MDYTSHLKSLGVARGYMKMKVDDLDRDALLEMPDGAGNNVLWNVGHIVHSHDSMLYGRCGAEMPTPTHWGDWFRAGTSPADWTEQPPVEDVLAAFNGQAPRIAGDAEKGVFDAYEAWDLVPGMTLGNAADALGFMLVHEGSHIGIVIGIRRLMGVKA